MRIRRATLTLAALGMAALWPATSFGAEAAPEEASQPPQPSAAIMTRTCEDGGALVVMNNMGGGTVSFTVLADNEASGSHDVGPGAQATQLVPIAEDQVRNIQVTAEGMAPVAGTRTRDCEATLGAAEGPGGSSGGGAPAPGSSDPIDEVPPGTPAPTAAPTPTAVAGASDAPDAAAGTSDAAIAPATDPVAPSGALPFTGATANLLWLGFVGMLLVAAGALAWRVSPRDRRLEVARVSSAGRHFPAA